MEHESVPICCSHIRLMITKLVLLFLPRDVYTVWLLFKSIDYFNWLHHSTDCIALSLQQLPFNSLRFGQSFVCTPNRFILQIEMYNVKTPSKWFQWICSNLSNFQQKKKTENDSLVNKWFYLLFFTLIFVPCSAAAKRIYFVGQFSFGAKPPVVSNLEIFHLNR